MAAFPRAHFLLNPAAVAASAAGSAAALPSGPRALCVWRHGVELGRPPPRWQGHQGTGYHVLCSPAGGRPLV